VVCGAHRRAPPILNSQLSCALPSPDSSISFILILRI
jgi:hypothetical protein